MQERHHMLGFTVIEMLVVFAVIGALALVSVQTFINMRNIQTLKVSTQDVWLALRSARDATFSAENDHAYGVHIESTRVTRFIAPTYASTTVSNTVYSLSDNVTATSTLTGGVQDVVFSRLSGNASATGTITLTQTISGATSSIRVSNGIIDII